ncbi:MAG: hypothetical protein RLZZ324_740 [Candidatus Parcubacteria bacterium]|jgi:signal transduction histidine kinase
MSIIFSIPTLVTLTSVINFCVAALTFLIGVAVLRQKQDSPVNQMFFFVAFNSGFWCFSSTMADVVREPSFALYWAQMALIGPFLLSAGFLVFSYFFPVKIRLPWWKIAIIFIPSIVATLMVNTKYNIETVTLRSWGTDYEPGPLFTALFIHLLVYFGLAARHFWRVYKTAEDKIVKNQVLFLSLGMALFVGSGVLTNLVLPLFGYTQSSVIGPASALFFVVFTMYAVVRHGLLNIKVIATEIFAGAFTFINFIQIFRSQSTGDFYINTLVFVVTSAAATLLIRSVLDEVSRREQLQLLTDQLEIANAHLQEMDTIKSEFISIASHQLRTPISIMKGYLSLMMEGAYGVPEGALKEKIGHMFQMNERLVLMVNNMLNVTRIEKNKIEFDCADMDVVPVIAEAVGEMQLKAKQKGLKAVFADPPKDPLTAYIDKEKLHEVLSNLMDNAAKYSEVGTISVRAVPFRAGKEVLITVTDEGVGMNKEDAEKLFQKFTRGISHRASAEQGTGLGLYVCKMFVEGMGGQIWIDKTAPGMGTTFAFLLATIPLRQCAKPKKKPVLAAGNASPVASSKK